MERSVNADSLTIIIELDDDGWVARVEGVADTRVSGASLSEVRRRMQALITRQFGSEVGVREQIRVDTDVGRRVTEIRAARSEIEQARDELRQRMLRTAAALRERGLSSRDAAALLGVSQQRVSQLWKESDELDAVTDVVGVE